MSQTLTDSRNLTDELKGKTEAEIIHELDRNGVTLEIAIENLERDFNMGSIVRSANAFGVRHIHVIGNKQWNKRGAMATDRYLHVSHYRNHDEFIHDARNRSRTLIAVDNVPGAIDIREVDIPAYTTLVFGSEANGVSTSLLDVCDLTVEIMQRGSTRSLNVGAAAAIAMYEWSRRHSY